MERIDEYVYKAVAVRFMEQQFSLDRKSTVDYLSWLEGVDDEALDSVIKKLSEKPKEV